MMKKLEKYAQLLIKKGVNLQPDQDLIIESDIENKDLVRLLVKEAYNNQAREVIVHYTDSMVSKMKYTYAREELFDEVPPHIVALKEQYALKHAAVLFIESEDPTLLKDVDPSRISRYSASVHKMCPTFYNHLDLGIDRWCIAAASSTSWAKHVFKDMDELEAKDALWEAIFKVTMIDEKDPLEAWDKHKKSFEEKVNLLNHSKIKSLHYTNNLGTDLTVGLLEDYLFSGGGSYTTDGIYGFPNIPTLEIFTSPSKYKVEGIVYNSLPLNYNGMIIDEFYLVFEQGRVVDYNAKIGNEVLKSIIEMDEGSHYLGEIALVPYDSPINNLNLLFYNTLFDENASCHLALGKGFCECIKDGYSKNKQELLEMGINDSLTHVDFMIGTSDLSIKATLENGQKMEIFKGGNYCI